MFKGVYTALITPFTKKGDVDYQRLKDLIEYQIAGKVAGIVPCGTTGESPTLRDDEQIEVISKAVQHARKRCTIIAGTGSNCTHHAVELSVAAQKAGADACLIVNPYYNKPTQEGLYRHFRAIANAVKIPVIVYNIKGRTAVNVETSTLMRLIRDCKNIAAVKEASGDLNQMKEVIAQAPGSFDVLSGDDNMTLELIKTGGRGVVSVASNLIPKQMVEFVDAALRKDPSAQRLNDELAELFKIIFIETNPIPIKAAMSMKGLCEEAYRLPMCELRPENRQKLKAFLESKHFI